MTAPHLHTVAWRRPDGAGHEAARLFIDDEGWRLAGMAVGAPDGTPTAVSYVVACDGEWRTRRGALAGWIGGTNVRLTLRVDPDGRWSLNGVAQPAAHGCIDVDYALGPATRAPAIRRLRLAVGEAAESRTARLHLPSGRLEGVTRRYARVADRTYRCEEDGGADVTLVVDAHGMPVETGGAASV